MIPDIRPLTFNDFNLFSPLVHELMGHTVDNSLLKQRYSEMFQQNYECFGIYDDENLIGVFGLWFMTRHYAGKSCEQDHVYILPENRNGGLGKKVFEWIFNYAISKGCETFELNSYVNNYPSHKFYMNLGYDIKGYHFETFVIKKYLNL